MEGLLQMPESGFPLLSVMIMTLPIGAALIWQTTGKPHHKYDEQARLQVER